MIQSVSLSRRYTIIIFMGVSETDCHIWYGMIVCFWRQDLIESQIQ